ncbi:LytR C-terminal domain-containing protein [Actinotalea sp. K2]|uniref:LytR C-terminal domain-containing protein n=1 Tax=Actinotalea sp. K2 TaxID=2939438 RepID=UPI002017E648|nr:LytR C-terminal domain-containing protein [Actinotalea sp. K2]MCL3861516.1 LytR C-terminal domain-containing protein [Actinotalea sp. K2]
MSKARYPHPQDEFDVVSDGPRGSHRAPRSAVTRWWPFLAVLVVLPVLAYGLVTWWSDWDGSPDSLPSVFTQDEPSEAPETTDDPTAEEPGEAAEDPVVEEPVEPEVPAPDVDLARAVQVMNGTGASGLAAGGRERLEAAGFTAVTTGNWQERPDVSVVYYPTEQDVTTAQTVAASLGITTVEESAEIAGDVVTAVLAADYTP